MIAIWYSIISFMLMAYVVLEGSDIGAGILQPIVGKTEDERRTVITAIGPLWSWHEVWIVGFGGTFLLSFPAVMAVTFSGFYLALMLLLWGLILRGVSIEVGGHINNPMWHAAWNFCFVASNVLLAILIGAALGNVIRGVPLGGDEKFSLAFFTNFMPFGNVGILDWYTISTAVFVLLLFVAHGANALAERTEGPVHDRSHAIACTLWKTVFVLLAVITVETLIVRSDMFWGIIRQPFGWIGLIAVAIGARNVVVSLRRNDSGRAELGSTLFIAGLMIAGAAGVFPVILRSTLGPQYSMTAYQTAAAGKGLAIALVWWPIAFILAVGYFLFSYRFFYTGKVNLSKDVQTPY
jgi:cytochrome bd ubiquinol oxidase subunit II